MYQILSGGIITRFVYIITALILLFTLSIVPAMAHSPSSMELDYDYNSQELTVTITHGVANTNTHYVDEITVYRNDIPVIEETYDSQQDNPTYSLVFDVTAVAGDVIAVYATCSISGDIESEIIVEGPRDYMYLTVNPEPEEVEMEEEAYMTVNVYATGDDTPLDGVSVVPDADLGYIGDVSDLGMGSYGFTYEAPSRDSEDIEVINLSCTKNGYHPLYYEFQFDLVLSRDGSTDIIITIDPTIYEMNEGETKTFDIDVKAGGEYLDVSMIDVDYSHGKVSTERKGTGKFEVTYTANSVDSDTTAYIKVSASKNGYTEGSDEIQFRITDTGDQQTDDGEQDGNYTLWVIIGLIAVVIAIIVIAIILIRRNRKTEYEEVQAIEVK